MIDQFYVFVIDYGWMKATTEYTFSQGEIGKVLVVRNQEEKDYCTGIAYILGYMPEIIICPPQYDPYGDVAFNWEVLATWEIPF